MLKLEALADRLSSLGVAEQYAFNKTPLRPNRCVTLTEIPGGIAELDTQDLDNCYFQVRSRGDINEPQQARDIAHAIDEAIMEASNWPTSLGGYLALCATRLGGAPHFLAVDDEHRASYICNYHLKIER